MDLKYINDFGLINAKLADINAENSPLWTLEYLLLENDSDLMEKLLIYINNSHTGTKGLYNQSPKLYGTPDDYMSPDQLIAFVGTFLLNNNKAKIKNIWKYLVKHLLSYDNLQPNKINHQRTMQLSAILYVGVSAGHVYLKPLLALTLIYSCWSKPSKTSGKLKAWVMFKTLNMKITEKICNWVISKNKILKSWKGIFLEYFQEEANPIRGKAKSLQ